jgi:hypothetical protein
MPYGKKYGGRVKGTPNKRTTQKRLLEAERAIRSDRPLPKDVLEEVMEGFLTQARRCTPLPGETDPKLLDEYERWGKNTAEVARMLAPYYHATYKAILVPDQQAKSGLLTDFYLNIFERRRAPAQIEAKPVNGNGKAE